MKSCAEIFQETTGFDLTKRGTDYRSQDEIDETIFEIVSRLFLERRQAFYCLKEKFEPASKKSKNRLLLSVLGYIYYIDCDFKKAISCLKKAIRIDPVDLETWFSLAFCYRQIGQENKFDSILLYHDRIIDEFRKDKKEIETLILKYAKKRQSRRKKDT